ncbi:MAG: hypothetical protein AAGF66_00755 [Cyanobacteria bacterium P01_H01_bin.119]
MVKASVLDSTGYHNRERWIGVLLFLGVVLFLLAFLKPGIWGFDGNDMLNMSKSLLREGSFSIPKEAGGVLGRDGQYYSIRYPLLPVVAMPFVAVGLFLGNLLNLPTHYTAAVCALVVSVLLTGYCTAMVFFLARRLGARQVGSFIASVCYAFGTVALVYSRELFAEPLLSAMTTTALYLALGKSWKAHIGASVLAALVITAKPAGVVVGPAIALYFLLKRYPIYRVLMPFLGTCAGMGLYFAYNYMRFGDILSSGQDASRFTLDGMVGRFVGLILSPGAGGGLFWYCPPTILAIVGLWKLWKHRGFADAASIAALFSGFWILHAFWEFGGWSWGPRFFVPTLPALMAATALLDRKGQQWLIALSGVGFLANGHNLITFYQRYYAEAADADRISQALSLWGYWGDAPIFNAWGATIRQINIALTTDVATVLQGVGSAPARGNLVDSDLLQILAVWWWMLPVAGIPVIVGVFVALLMVVAGLGCLWWGWRLAHPSGKVKEAIASSRP